MRYQLSDDQAMIQESVRRFAEAEVLPNAYEWDVSADASPSVMAALAELGLMGMRVSPDNGGSGLDPIATLIAVEALAAADGGLAWTVALHNLLALVALEPSGHPMVAALAAGDGVASWFEAPLRAEVEGSDVRLFGAAPLVPWALHARLLVGLVKSASGPLIVAAASDAEGIRTTATDGAMGLRSSAQATVRFEGAPAKVLTNATKPGVLHGWFRLCRAAVAVGVAKGALTAATRYAQERHQFNKPISQFQAIQWMLAETATEIDAARLLVWSAVGPDGQPDSVAAARASLYTLPAATRAGMRAVQIYGGNGFVREYPVERCLRDAKALEVLRTVDEDQDHIVSDALANAS